MMAVKSPLMPSPSALMSAFSPYTDSPSSPRRISLTVDREKAHTTHPLSTVSPYVSSNLDVLDPSPIAPSSNGTEITEIEDDATESEEALRRPFVGTLPALYTPRREIFSAPLSIQTRIQTENTSSTYPVSRPTSDEEAEPQSVIHAPPGFGEFRVTRSSPPMDRRSTQSPSQRSDITIKSPRALEIKNDDKKSTSPISPPPISTDVNPSKDLTERPTPRAQTRQEIEGLDRRPRSTSLEDIPEGHDQDLTVDNGTADDGDVDVSLFSDNRSEVEALRMALSECWTLCNTLASLSYIHRERIFNFSGKGDMQEQAWKTCWSLCQNLYDNREDDSVTQVRPTLELCRDFCQALFEVRERENEVTDSVLRVSFELNNHLYNTHDRSLPEAFRERTLDFYITLCHRLMKQRTRLAEETDSLLRACWSLAEMLFSLRQNRREGKRADEELLGSAVQACWELCDLFREGWTQIRPDRGTPRPSQTTFSQAYRQASKAAELATVSENNSFKANPETPTTIFEDTQTISPDEAPVPNILVLGPNLEQRAPTQQRWSSAASTFSGYSRGSRSSERSERTTSSTNTVTTPSEEPALVHLRLLIVKAAMNSGYQRGGPQNLPSFVKSLSSNSFGTAPWQMKLLDNYKNLVQMDPGFKTIRPPTRVGAADVALAVSKMVSSGQYLWLEDLFRLVFGFRVEDAPGRGNVSIQT